MQYIVRGDKPIMEQVLAAMRDSDSVIVYGPANYSFDYYGRWPGDLVPMSTSTKGFYVIPRRPHTLVLPEIWHGIRFKDHMEAMDEPLRRFLSDSPQRVVFFGTDDSPAEHDRAVDAIRRVGYRVVGGRFDADAEFAVLERRAPAPPR